jgi:hypothetical protein
MRGSRRFVTLMSALLAAAATPPPLAAQTVSNIPSTLVPCMADIFLTPVKRSPNSAVLRVVGQQTAFGGDVTVDGERTTWRGHVARGATVPVPHPPNWPYLPLALNESSVLLVAPGRIRAVEFRPAGAACAMHAALQPRGPEWPRLPKVPRPTVALGDAAAFDPPRCRVPYATADITDVVYPEESRRYLRVNSVAPEVLGVALDARGTPSAINVVQLPPALSRSDAFTAVVQSTFSPAVWRCARVPDGLLYTVPTYAPGDRIVNS